MIIYHHLGLGDHFVCNGLVNFIAKNYQSIIYLICKKKNLSTVKYLYSDNDKINVIPIPGINEFDEISELAASMPDQKILIIGFNHCDPNNWDRSFYSQLSLPFEIRYSHFKLPKNKPNVLIPVTNKNFILIHSTTSVQEYSLKIESDKNKIYITDNISDNLFSYLDLIYSASEIHCVNSSVFHLIDSLTNINASLYYHDIRRSDNTYFQVNKKWNIIKYS